MSDYIKREDAIKIINSGISIDTDADKRYVNGLFRAIRTADVAPVRHGRWEYDGEEEWWCSECDWGVWLSDGRTPKEHEYHYCPCCGAKMDARKDNPSTGE